MNLKKIILNIFLCVYDFIVGFFLREASKPEYKSLVIFRLDGIGDYVVWTDTVSALEKLYPDYEITLVHNSLWSSLAKNNKCFDKYISVDRQKFCNNLLYRFSILKELKKASYSIALNPIYTRRNHFQTVELMMRMVNASQKIGFNVNTSKSLFIRLNNKHYTTLIESRDENKSEIIRNADFIRALGLPDFQGGMPYLKKDKFEKPEFIEDETYYVLVPGAGSKKRMWPTPKFVQISQKIFKKTGIKGFICGSKNEEYLGEQIVDSSNAELENLAGKTTIFDVVGIVKNAKFVISNETSAIHIAAAIRTKSVCLLGGGHFNRFAPYKLENSDGDSFAPRCCYDKMNCFNCDWDCIYDIEKDEVAPCVENIKTNEVWNKIKEIISEESVAIK